MPGVLVQALGEGWAAYSPLAGSSHVLNDSGAAVLDVLAERGPSPAGAVAAVIAGDVGLPTDEIEAALEPLWGELILAGLVREVPADPTGPAEPEGRSAKVSAIDSGERPADDSAGPSARSAAAR